MNDLISRQAAICWVKTECNPYGKPSLDYKSCIKVIEHLKEMPSAEKHGGWIKMSDRYGTYYACSECGEDLPRISRYTEFDLLPRLESIDRTNYCSYCGAKMDKGDANG